MFNWIKKLVSAKVLKRVVGVGVRAAVVFGAAQLIKWGVDPEIATQFSNAAPEIASWASEVAVALYLLLEGGVALVRKK